MIQTFAASRMRLFLHSTLLAVLAFNLVFFLQEVFLVLPKALVPGLNPTLFHNNHNWSGSDPIAELLQGTGALAILIAALASLALLRRVGGGTARLLLLWIAFSGFYQALPQVVIGALVPMNDVGRAMTWLGLGSEAKGVAALFAVLVMMLVGRMLARLFLGFAPDGKPGRTVLLLATLPALLAIPLILPFRVPGSLDQVVLVPVIMQGAGALFVQLGAMRAQPAPGPQGPPSPAIWTLAALALVLGVFHLVLRPGINVF